MRSATKMLLMNSPRRENRDGRVDNRRYEDLRIDNYRDDMHRNMRNTSGSRNAYPHYPGPYRPPYYDEGLSSGGMEPHRNRIGFSVDGEMEHIPDEFREDYPMNMAHTSANDMEYSHKASRISGYAESQPQITREMAMHWAKNMENEDGTQGPHWTMEQTKQVQAQQNIECDPVEFFLAMNMMYSDYVKVAKKLGVNKVDFYSCMAKAFLDDKDAGPDKLGRYFEYVVGD